MSKPQKNFSGPTQLKNSPIGPKNAQNDPFKTKNKKRQKTKKSYKTKIISLHE